MRTIDLMVHHIQQLPSQCLFVHAHIYSLMSGSSHQQQYYTIYDTPTRLLDPYPSFEESLKPDSACFYNFPFPPTSSFLNPLPHPD